MFLLIITVTLSLYLNGVIHSQICIYAYWAFKVPIKEERTESCLLQTHFDKSALLFTAGPCGERLKRNSGHTSKSKTGKWKLLD